ncbi:MAG: DUF4440 domain-containing protein, partial [Bacteroidota bacterium]
MKTILLLCCLISTSVLAQQYPDTLYVPPLRQSAYPLGEGPRVVFDAGHQNFGADLRANAALEKLLLRDGYQVSYSTETFDRPERLADVEVLVIINALHADNVGQWYRPVHSAFSKKEVKVLKQWVAEGGNLLLVADHMPFGGAAKELASAFGVAWLDGFAKIEPTYWPPSHFEGDEMLRQHHPVVKGLEEREKLTRVASFTGSAFLPPPEAEIALAFLPEHRSVQPDTAWRFKENTPEVSLPGHAQGATLAFGKGRLACWGEAGMLIAQVFRGDWKGGFNSPYAPENAQLVLNLFHWLSGRSLPYTGPLHPAPAPDTSQLQREVLAANRALEQAFREGDLLTVSYFYDDEAKLIGPGFQLEGRESIDKYWFRLEGLTEDWLLTAEHLDGTGDMAWQTGQSTISYRDRDTDRLKTNTVRFSLVWRKNW